MIIDHQPAPDGKHMCPPVRLRGASMISERYTPKERRQREAERLAWLEDRDRRWAAGTVDDMYTEMRRVDCLPDEELRQWVEHRHAKLVAYYGGAS